MKIAYENENVTLWHGDCREWSGKADAVVSDPPYGIDYKPGKFWNGVGIVGDQTDFDPQWVLSLCMPSVLWGANAYANRLPNCYGWLIWNKRDRTSKALPGSDAELAWTNCVGTVEIFTKVWMPHTIRGEKVLHPTQKPVGLMAWCMERAKVPTGATVLDPYAGSSTTLIAALETGRKAIGIEIDERWVEVARRRLERWHAQGRLDFGTANAGGERTACPKGTNDNT